MFDDLSLVFLKKGMGCQKKIKRKGEKEREPMKIHVKKWTYECPRKE